MSDLDLTAPFVGPRPFERADADLFFGRGRERHELTALVLAHRVVVLYAASGAGKTSLINAGLEPLLEREGFDLLPVARLRPVVAQDEPPDDVNAYSYGVLSAWAATDRFSGLALDYHQTLTDFLTSLEHPIDTHGFAQARAVIFDQFEELFTAYPQRWEERAHFIRDLAEATDADDLLRVVLAIREDHLGELEAHEGLFRDRLRHRLRLEPLRAVSALEAITQPFAKFDRSFAPGIADQLLHDLLRIRVESNLQSAVDVLGEFIDSVQLQVVCLRLWTYLPSDVTEITEDHLREFGDVDEALRQYYAAAIETSAETALLPIGYLRRIFEATFVTPGGTRGTAWRGPKSTGSIPNSAIDELERWHVIRAERRHGGRWYELTHDRLIEPLQSSNRDYEANRARRLTRFAAFGITLFVALLLAGSLSRLPSHPAAPNVCTKCDVSIFSWTAKAKRGKAIGIYFVELSGPRPGVFPVTWQVRKPSSFLAIVTQRTRSLRLSQAGHRRLRGRIPISLPSGGGTFDVVLSIYRPGAGPTASPLNFSTSRVTLPPERRRFARLVVHVTRGGRVRSFPMKINCPNRCAAQFIFGTQALLEAQPLQKFTFVGWSGSCSGNSASCLITVRGAARVHARFRVRRGPH